MAKCKLPPNSVTVAQLIAHLQTMDQNLPVVYRFWSAQTLLELKDLEIKQLCEPRPDGWVHNARPDQPTRPYLMLPGN